MKIQVISDLHIERYSFVPNPLDFVDPKAEILILAGDVGRIHKYKQLHLFLEKLCSYFKIVLYVLGNQEFYYSTFSKKREMVELYSMIYDIKKNIPNLFILNRSSVVFNDICIAGCTLWSNPNLDIPKFIKIHNITLEKYKRMFQKDLQYIRNLVQYCNDNKLKLCLITHYSPSYLTINNPSRDKYISYYVNKLDFLFKEPSLKWWIFGHTNENYDNIRYNTRLISNQKGKKFNELDTFDRQKIISLT